MDDSFVLFEEKIRQFSFREHQIKAANAWVSNNYAGIMEMATGTGKTHAAILAMYKLIRENWELSKPTLVLVVVPSLYLENQWLEVLQDFTKSTIIIDYSAKKRMNFIKNSLELMNRNELNHLILIQTEQSLHRIKELSVFDSGEFLLIADEVQWVGAKKSQEFLSNYTYPQWLLGLSATPERIFDAEGTDFIESYFKGYAFKYSIENAQQDGILSKYDYIPIICSLNEQEVEEYRKMSIEIAVEYNRYKDQFYEFNEKLNNLILSRAKILKKCEDKINQFDNLIRILKKEGIAKSVIFCEDNEQKQQCISILEKHFISFSEFIAETTKKDRIMLRDAVESGEIKFIVSILCMDQGVDIPALEYGFFLSQTQNPRQYIQRLGRLLRKTLNKKEPVRVYDLIIGNFGEMDEKCPLLTNIIQTEWRRIEFFLKYATESSRIHALNLLNSIPAYNNYTRI
jgi:superfamily II DNA or RNA helicase